MAKKTCSLAKCSWFLFHFCRTGRNLCKQLSNLLGCFEGRQLRLGTHLHHIRHICRWRHALWKTCWSSLSLSWLKSLMIQLKVKTCENHAAKHHSLNLKLEWFCFHSWPGCITRIPRAWTSRSWSRARIHPSESGARLTDHWRNPKKPLDAIVDSLVKAPSKHQFVDWELLYLTIT